MSEQATTELLTAAEVGERLAVGERYVWKLGREGKLPRVKVGKYIRFHPEDVESFIIEAREGPRGSQAVHEAELPARRRSPAPATRAKRF